MSGKIKELMHQNKTATHHELQKPHHNKICNYQALAPHSQDKHNLMNCSPSWPLMIPVGIIFFSEDDQSPMFFDTLLNFWQSFSTQPSMLGVCCFCFCFACLFVYVGFFLQQGSMLTSVNQAQLWLDTVNHGCWDIFIPFGFWAVADPAHLILMVLTPQSSVSPVVNY